MPQMYGLVLVFTAGSMSMGIQSVGANLLGPYLRSTDLNLQAYKKNKDFLDSILLLSAGCFIVKKIL